MWHETLADRVGYDLRIRGDCRCGSGGKGCVTLATYENCDGCGGTGETYLGAGEFSGRCWICNGDGLIKLTTKARKEHRCDFCRKPIAAGEEYIRREITPWDHSDNETFFTHKSHVVCNDVWYKFGERYDWVYPEDGNEWAELVAEYEATTKQKGDVAGETSNGR